MSGALISLILLVIVVGVVVYIVGLLLDKVPMDAGFKKIAYVLIVLVAILIVCNKALPLLGVAAPF